MGDSGKQFLLTLRAIFVNEVRLSVLEHVYGGQNENNSGGYGNSRIGISSIENCFRTARFPAPVETV